MALIETERGQRARITRQSSCSLEGPAQLLLADGRRVRVDARLSMSRTFFSLSGGGSFTCETELAFDAIDSSSWLTLIFEEGRTVEISVYQLRSGCSQTRCWFEVRG